MSLALRILDSARGKLKRWVRPPDAPAPAEQLPTPLAFDYRLESMDPAGIIAAGYRDAVVSWRQNDTAPARAHLDTLRAGGVRLWVTIEPWVRATADAPTTWASDIELWNLALAHNAWLRKTDGSITNPASEFFGVGGTRGLDFSNVAFAQAWADWIWNRWPDIAGVYHDYGFPTGGLSWVNGYGDDPNPGVPDVPYPGNWAAWASGYQAAFERERLLFPSKHLLLAQYGTEAVLNPAIPPRATGVIIEGIGAGLIPPVETPAFFTYRKAWQIAREARDAGIRPMLWNLHGNLRNRRLIACMAVAARGFMDWRWRQNDAGQPTDLWSNKRIPELMDLSIGDVAWPPTPLATDVWLASGSRGYVVVNVSGGSHVYGGRTVASNDGLMVQTHAVGGAPLPTPLTNEGI